MPKTPLPGRSVCGIIDPMTETTDNKQKLTWQIVEDRLDEIVNEANADTKQSALKSLTREIGIGCVEAGPQNKYEAITKNIDKIRDWIRETRNDQRLDRAAELAERADKRADQAAELAKKAEEREKAADLREQTMLKVTKSTKTAMWVYAIVAVATLIISIIALSRS
jgi:hypothetical protein